MDKLKDFLKDNSREIVRFVTNQLVISLLGVSVCFATLKLDNLAVSILASVFCICFLCFLHYDSFFQMGIKDCFKSKDVPHPKKTLGLKVAFLASSPIIFIAVLGFVLQAAQLHSAAVIVKLIYCAVEGDYIQLHSFYTTSAFYAAGSNGAFLLEWLFLLLYSLPAILFSALGYFLGAQDKPIYVMLGFRRAANKNEKK